MFPPTDLAMLAAPAYASQKLPVDKDSAHRAAGATTAPLSMAVRRHRSKLYQRRYRADQKKAATLLKLSIATLYTDVARMEGSVEAMRLAVPTALRSFEPEHKIAHEFFRVMGHGLCIDPSSTKHRTHVDFLTSVMANDLVIMGSVGRDKLFDQWTLYVTTFASFKMDLVDLHIVSFSPAIVIHANASLRLRISRETIRVLLPQFVHLEPLVQRMIGHDLELPVQLRFVYDEHGVVQELGTTANIIGALLSLLGNLDDALTVLDRIHIAEDAQIVLETQENSTTMY